MAQLPKLENFDNILFEWQTIDMYFNTLCYSIMLNNNDVEIYQKVRQIQSNYTLHSYRKVLSLRKIHQNNIFNVNCHKKLKKINDYLEILHCELIAIKLTL